MHQFVQDADFSKPGAGASGIEKDIQDAFTSQNNKTKAELILQAKQVARRDKIQAKLGEKPSQVAA